jgi:Trypsin/RTX calcium-binding nonapeptide repeat (4 copies)
MFDRSSGNSRQLGGALCACICLLGLSGGGAGAAPHKSTDESRAGHSRGVTVSQKRGDEVNSAVAPGQRRQLRKRSEEKLFSSPPGGTIVGGTVAPVGAYPFFVSLKRASDNFAFCGGTLVSSVWVLTAAHCVDGGTTAASLKLVIGANQLSDETTGDVRSVTAIHLHPSWNPGTFDNDVALLRLNTASIKPWARFAEPVDPVNAGDTVRAIGHGHTSQGGVGSDDLRQVDLPIQSDATMSDPARYGSSFHGAVMLGAGPLAGGMDTCQGDSGGPLFIAGGQARLVGDTSWGSGCAQSNKPGIYGEVYQGALRTFVNGLVGRPANDNFAGFGTSGADGSPFGSNTDSTGQTGEPSIAGSTPDTTVWYSWTAPENGPTSFNTRDAAFDTTLHVFTGSSLGTLSSVALNDDFNGTLQSKVTFTAAAGTTYRIAVDGFGAAHGPFTLQYAQNSPANDSFATPASITGATGKASANTARSTGEPGEPSHGSVPDRSVWYTWTAPETGTASFNTRESNFDTALAVYTGTSITGLTQLASNDDVIGSSQSKVTFRAVAGTTYRIAVDGFGGTTGSLGLQWTTRAPANDNFAQARLISGVGAHTVATTVRSTGEPGELDYHGGAIADNSVWFRWRAPASAPAVVRLFNVAATLGPGIGVYTGTSLGALTSVGSGGTSASFPAVAGTEYRIAVDGNSGSTGAFTLEHVLGDCNGRDATHIGRGTINGGPGNDVIVGSTGNDVITGGGGHDTICARSGNDDIGEGSSPSGADRIDGGEGGLDKVRYGGRTTAVNVTLNGIANDGATGEGDNVLTSVEQVVGGSGGDTLTGSGFANTLEGLGGADRIRGGAGNDKLVGGAGADWLFGEGGLDALNLVDGVNGNDRGDGGTETDTATADPGDTVIGVP